MDEKDKTISKLEAEKYYLGERIFELTGVEEGFWSDEILVNGTFFRILFYVFFYFINISPIVRQPSSQFVFRCNIINHSSIEQLKERPFFRSDPIPSFRR